MLIHGVCTDSCTEHDRGVGLAPLIQFDEEAVIRSHPNGGTTCANSCTSARTTFCQTSLLMPFHVEKCTQLFLTQEPWSFVHICGSDDSSLLARLVQSSYHLWTRWPPSPSHHWHCFPFVHICEALDKILRVSRRVTVLFTSLTPVHQLYSYS